MPHALYVANPHCPECDQSFETLQGLSVHWARWCDRGHPALAEEQHEILTGLLLGGAILRVRTTNPSIVATTKYRGLAAWTADQLGWLVTSLRRVPRDTENGETYTYQVGTLSHPELSIYRDWRSDSDPKSSEKLSPPIESLALSDRTLRTVFAYRAYLAWNTNHDTH